MKRIVIVTIAFLLSVGGFLMVGQGILPDLYFHYKNSEYYKWKAGESAFSEQYFWNGFNADRTRNTYFAGRTLSEIERGLPILLPIDATNERQMSFVRQRHGNPAQFRRLSDSYYLLQFDDHGKFIDLFLAKG